MPLRKDSPNRNDTFGRLLSGAINSIATYEGRTAPVVEEELGQLLTLSGKTIQRYKSGHLPPEDRTIAILATAAVQRGYLGREWLQRFLHAARYPFADTLLDRLCPIGPARPRPPRVYHNLPAPTYSQFVMRAQAFAEVREGLGKQSAIVLIVGLGGNGKTSLAREAAAHCLVDDGAMLRFDAVVWVSDKDRPGTTNLSIVLDEIARTLDYPGFTQFEHDEKRREVENLLRRQRVLIVVDNFETISDGALLSWLQNLSEPSKALITAREYRREYRRGGWLVELRGMTYAEAHQFAGERLRMLRIAHLVSDQAQLEPLLAATGGNPKAIEIALGLVKHERRPLQQVVDDLYAARGELFDDLFTRAWALLDEAARRMLMVLTFFPTSASSEALAATADIQGFAFDCATERLIDLALIDEQRIDLASAPRYTLHPLVRAFVGAQLAKQQEFEIKARERWVQWYIDLASEVGYCWDDLGRLELLDLEQETAFSVVKWTYQYGHYVENLRIAKSLGISYYYYVRGFWNEKQSVDRMHIDAAHRLKSISDEIGYTSHLIFILSRQGNISEINKYLPKLYKAVSSVNIEQSLAYIFHQAIAMYHLVIQDIDNAQKSFQASLDNARNLQEEIRVHRWLAICLYQKGEVEKSESLFRKWLEEARIHDYKRGITFIQSKLANIALDRGDLEGAAYALAESSVVAHQSRDREHIAKIQYLYARLHTLRGDYDAARAALAEAIDLFERLGMRRELAEARAELAQLDEPIAAAD